MFIHTFCLYMGGVERVKLKYNFVCVHCAVLSLYTLYILLWPALAAAMRGSTPVLSLMLIRTGHLQTQKTTRCNTYILFHCPYIVCESHIKTDKSILV